MSKLVINDLAVSKDLDQAAAIKICGGFSTAAFVARHKQKELSLAPGSIYSVVNNFDFNYNVYNNATLFNVYNGANNSGVIVNDFNATTLTAASPTLIGLPSST